MKNPPPSFLRSYQASLSSYFEVGLPGVVQSLQKLSKRARAHDLSIMDLAKLHEHHLVFNLLPSCTAEKRTAMIRDSSDFFAAVATAHNVSINPAVDCKRLAKTIGSQCGRNVVLASANRDLNQEITQCRKVEAALRKSQENCLKALAESELLREQLRAVSKNILVIQEDERKKISRELHDVVAQTLLGINARLASLNTEAGADNKSLSRNIVLTQKMISKSAAIVHKFAKELRPAVLDDLGLIPALKSFMENFTDRTGVRVSMTVFKEVEKLNAIKRTILYRVVQESLTNVAQHASASSVKVIILKTAGSVSLQIIDDGKSFDAVHNLNAKRTKRLGLLGMRERVELVGGRFEIDSSPGNGTTITVTIPVKETKKRSLVVKIK